MADNEREEIDLYDGEYTPKPFVMEGETKMVSIIVSIIAAVACLIILANTVFANANENDILGVLNVIVTVGVGCLAYVGMTCVAKFRYRKRTEAERAAFEEKKREAIPYTVCEFCGGRIGRKYYKSGESVSGGWYLTNGTLAHHTNRTEHGIDVYNCETCGYIAEGVNENTLAGYGINVMAYTAVRTEVFEGSPISEEQLKAGRLVAYLNSKIIVKK